MLEVLLSFAKQTELPSVERLRTASWGHLDISGESAAALKRCLLLGRGEDQALPWTVMHAMFGIRRAETLSLT